MNDIELKQLISQLTGVEIVKTAMPLLSGQVRLENRVRAFPLTFLN
jgi:hypothetical protein